MGRMTALALACLAISGTGAFSQQRMDPARVNGNYVDVCSGPSDRNDCSDTGLFEAAAQACIENNRGNKADHWAIAGVTNVNAEHWTGSGWALLPSGAVFSWMDCSGG
jgi:hypothetical protein